MNKKLKNRINAKVRSLDLSIFKNTQDLKPIKVNLIDPYESIEDIYSITLKDKLFLIEKLKETKKMLDKSSGMNWLNSFVIYENQCRLYRSHLIGCLRDNLDEAISIEYHSELSKSLSTFVSKTHDRKWLSDWTQGLDDCDTIDLLDIVEEPIDNLISELGQSKPDLFCTVGSIQVYYNDDNENYTFLDTNNGFCFKVLGTITVYSPPSDDLPF